MKPIKVLFVCVHNSARSQMAETYFNHYGKGQFIAESGGLEKGELNPIVVDVMAEDGFDISNNEVNSAFEFFKQGRLYSYVITVCDESTAEKCPIFPGVRDMLHWSLEDPSTIEGSKEEKLVQTRLIRDEIKNYVINFIEELNKKI